MTTAARDTLRIVHLASLARCGETLVQRALSAHPQVHVVFDLLEPNRPQDLRLFHFLRVWPGDTVPRWQLERHLAPGTVPAHKQVLLLKQGIFQPAHRPQAFGLVRNPYASFCSLWRYDAQLAGQPDAAAHNRRHWFAHRLPRLMVWADCTVPWLLPALRAERDPARQFLLFWRARMQQVLAQSGTVLRYERFVQEPEAELRRLCTALGLPWEPALLQAHGAFAAGQRGHGGIDLAAPIRPAPPWRQDPQVDLAPFAAEVDHGPVALYRGFYGAPQDAPPAAPREAIPHDLDQRHGAALGRVLALCALPALPAWRVAAEAQADGLGFALGVAVLAKIDRPAYDRLRTQLLAQGHADADGLDAASAPLALALMALQPGRAAHLALLARMLEAQPAAVMSRLLRVPALAGNAPLLPALLRRLQAGEIVLNEDGWRRLLVLGSAALPGADFDALLLLLRQRGGGRAAELARRHRLPGEAPAVQPARRPLRVALCISGQLRGWRQAAPSWHRLGLQGHEVDVIVHTWRQVGRRIPDPGNPATLERVFADAAFRAAWRETALRLTMPVMHARYPRFIAGLAGGDTVDASDLRPVYGPRAEVVVDDEREARFRDWSNPDKMHYKIAAAQALAERAGRGHDLVIRFRPDRGLLPDSAPVDWAALAADSESRRVIFCENAPELREGLAIGDQFAAGAPGPMRAYASAWTLLPRARAEGWPDFPPRLLGHQSLAFGCLWQGVRVEAMPGLRFGPLLDDRRLEAAELRVLLAADMPAGPRDAADRRLLDALHPACVAEAA